MNWIDDLAEIVWAWVGLTCLGLIGAAVYFAASLFVGSLWPADAAERGIASVFSQHERHNRWTASGVRMNDRALWAAHRTLPFHTKVRIWRGHRSTIVEIMERGPLKRSRVLDLSPAAAQAIGLPGLGAVNYSVLN